MKRLLLAMAAATGLVAVGPAFAGNIVLTGHDNDYHYNGVGGTAAGGPGAALLAEINFVRNGSSLPVLTFDAGSQLTNSLTGLGIAFNNVDPGGTISASLFDHTKYSAFAVASESGCGGCDNSATDIAIDPARAVLENRGLVSYHG